VKDIDYLNSEIIEEIESTEIATLRNDFGN